MGRPTFNKDYSLNASQKSIVVGSLLTDASLEMGKKNVTPRISLQASLKNEPVLEYRGQELAPIIKTQTPRSVFKTCPDPTQPSGRSVKVYEQKLLRTVNHPSLLEFIDHFGGAGREKTVPKVSYLVQVLDWKALGLMIMLDGSRKGLGGQGMEFHLQGFVHKAPLGRLCHALYRKFGIKAWPSYYGINSKGQKSYHIQISAQSLHLIRRKCFQYILPSFQYKIPPLAKRQGIHSRRSPWNNWYPKTKNATWLEDLSPYPDNLIPDAIFK